MKPGRRGPNFEEKPSVCHKTPPQNPGANELRGTLFEQYNDPMAIRSCFRNVLVRKHPQFEYYDWIAVGCGSACQGNLSVSTEMFFKHRFFSNLIVLATECVHFRKDEDIFFGNLDTSPPIRFDAGCAKTKWTAVLKIGGMKVTWEPA